MTRKKFIQLAMSKGYDRNSSVELADMVLLTGRGYYLGFVQTLMQLKPMELYKEFYCE